MGEGKRREAWPCVLSEGVKLHSGLLSRKDFEELVTASQMMA